MLYTRPLFSLISWNNLEDMPEPRTLVGAWKEMTETWRTQKFDQYYQFDTPVPDSRMKDKRVNADPLASSIGDLAPNF